MTQADSPDILQLPNVDLSRDAVIRRIKSALERRSGKKWSVTGGRGTAYGWITITAPPKRCDEYGCLTPEDRQQLAFLLGFDSPEYNIGPGGENVPAQHDFYQEFIDRAEGREPHVKGVPLWD